MRQDDWTECWLSPALALCISLLSKLTDRLHGLRCCVALVITFHLDSCFWPSYSPGGGYGAYPPAGYPGYGGQPPGYTTTTTTTTVVGAQPSRAGLSPGDQATAARRQRERENDRKLFGLLCGGCLCALCVGVDRAAVSNRAGWERGGGGNAMPSYVAAAYSSCLWRIWLIDFGSLTFS